MSCAVHLKRVRFRYPDGQVALAGVDLHIEHGERVALLGPNGAGKTTLVFHLNGLLRGEGELEVAGVELTDKTVREVRSRVGIVFQDPDDQLFMPTVREDVAFGPLNLGLDRDAALDRVDEALATVRMQHVAERSPHQLSMGERRRVAIATVLAMRPDLLVLDEPSANLDPARAASSSTSSQTSTGRCSSSPTTCRSRRSSASARFSSRRGGSSATGRARGSSRTRSPLAKHDLELPAGFVPGLVLRRPRPPVRRRSSPLSSVVPPHACFMSRAVTDHGHEHELPSASVLRERGKRLTVQRAAIWDVLAARAGPSTSARRRSCAPCRTRCRS